MNDDLIFLFYQEKYNSRIIRDDNGYILYNKYEDNSVYIQQLYVRPEFRNEGLGKQLEDELIEKENPSVIFCEVDLESNNPEISLAQIIKKAGYKIDRISNDGMKLVLYKKVNY